VENARIDEHSAKLAALKELVRLAEKQVVDIQHDNSLVFNQIPRVYLVQREFEPLIKIMIRFVWVLNVVHHHDLRTFVTPAITKFVRRAH